MVGVKSPRRSDYFWDSVLWAAWWMHGRGAEREPFGTVGEALTACERCESMREDRERCMVLQGWGGMGWKFLR